MSIDAEMVEGRRGQFEILVDGQVVIERRGGLLAKLFGKPWPDSEDVVNAVRAATNTV